MLFLNMQKLQTGDSGDLCPGPGSGGYFPLVSAGGFREERSVSHTHPRRVSEQHTHAELIRSTPLPDGWLTT